MKLCVTQYTREREIYCNVRERERDSCKRERDCQDVLIKCVCVLVVRA